MNSKPLPSNETAPCLEFVATVIAALKADAIRGLSNAEARTRWEQQGRNELTAKPPEPAWKKFLVQFKDVLVIVLLIATAISTVLWLVERESALPYEALVIFAVVLLNAVMGYVQQSRAESAVAALRHMTAARANVIREGKRKNIPGAELVTSDFILVEAGDTIPADARLVHCIALQTAEASLAGESLPVLMDSAPLPAEAGLGDRLNLIFSGTAATSGGGKAIVIATGRQTEMGRIAGMLNATPKVTTPLQKELDHVGKLLGIMVRFIAVVIPP